MEGGSDLKLPGDEEERNDLKDDTESSEEEEDDNNDGSHEENKTQHRPFWIWSDTYVYVYW